MFDRTKEQYKENQQQQPASTADRASAAVTQLQQGLVSGASNGLVLSAGQSGPRGGVEAPLCVTMMAGSSSCDDYLSLCSSPTADMSLGQVGWSATDARTQVQPGGSAQDGNRPGMQGGLGRDHGHADEVVAGRQVDLLKGLAQHRALHGSASFGTSATPRLGDGQHDSDLIEAGMTGITE
jgi:hypothetical protein